MSTIPAPSIEATMPAASVTRTDLGEYMRSHPVTLGEVVRAAGPFGGSEKAVAVLKAQEPTATGSVEDRLIAANQRAALLAEQLAAVTAELDAAEHRIADLDDRNRELAGDLDNALDQLAGHALHAEQERLFHSPRYAETGSALAGLGGNAFCVATSRDGAER
ncbi:hypothetical protein ACFVMC_33090 [Nocardia sp. NPDC127579]|uniref:hypothetical protein n=1 Tax=Nocardia sp. NPDC127579 TaxID=3345402 RepID=UPI003642022B